MGPPMNYKDALDARAALRVELPSAVYGAHLNKRAAGDYEVQLIDTAGNQENFDDILQVYLFLEDYGQVAKEKQNETNKS
jgi:hypothetical protein